MNGYRGRLIPVVVLMALCCSDLLAVDHTMKGQPAPGFDLQSLSGDRVDIEDFRGKLVVLHFGAGW